MSDTLLVSILGIAASLGSGITSYVLGQRAERKKQSLLIRAEMLKPISEWLCGAEKIVGMFSDTINSVLHDLPTPANYDFNERKAAFNFMSERTNEILGIIQSNSLSIKSTKLLAQELSLLINSIDKLIKFELLPMENEILVRSMNDALDINYVKKVSEEKLKVDSQLQKAYSLISQIKTTLT